MTLAINDSEVTVRAGDTIARRFVVVSSDDADVPGVDRFLGRDTRLGTDVTINIVTSLAPTSVVRAAQRARVLRDPRLVRVLAAGVEGSGKNRLAYVVTERPHGVRLDELLGRVALTPASAGAVIGEAASALVSAGLAGEHHGMLRDRSIVVTARGRVVVAGLGIDGELAGQAGLGKGRREKADALALTRLYLAAVTAMDADAVTRDDLPDDLPRAARDLCVTYIKGSGPHTLASVATALGTGRTPLLRALVEEAPRLWWPRSAGGLVPDSDEVEVGAEFVDAEGVAAPLADAADASLGADALDDTALDTPDLDATALDETALDETDLDETALDADAVATGELPVVPETPEAPAAPERPRTRFGGAVDDLDEFHDIVADQNAQPRQAVLEAILERLHGRFPGSVPLANAARAAHRRAQAPAPFRPAPLLVSLMVLAIFVATVMAISRIQQPLEPPGGADQPHVYPEYTFGIDATPSPSD